jgi:hypothetical protein
MVVATAAAERAASDRNLEHEYSKVHPLGWKAKNVVGFLVTI